MHFSRRSFLASALASSASAASPRAMPTLCIFSKHLPKLNFEQLGRVSHEIGFGGVDLTVRPGGHVLPERAAEDLPRAMEAIRSAGLAVPMITTGLVSAGDPAASPSIATAARLGIRFFKPGYWRYRADRDVELTIADVKRNVRELAQLAAKNGIAMGLHNHSGDYVGAAVWDTREVLDAVDPRWAGYYFDPCHATAEGGVYGWQLACRIALQNLKMVAVKDFYWVKTGGRWKMTMCPLGEGMVDWKKFFSLLAAANFAGPISLHLEYEAPDERAAIARDFEFLRKQAAAAYQAAGPEIFQRHLDD